MKYHVSINIFNHSSYTLANLWQLVPRYGSLVVDSGYIAGACL